MAATKLRSLVSKEKRRYQKNGYDLDLTYITDQVIAMGFPSEGTEGVYRNPLKEIQRFLTEFHDGHYRVYNLCSERHYDKEKFGGAVEEFPFDDHNAPQLETVFEFCKSVHAWLQADKKNVSVIHCKAGKGRTGVMIACYLMFAEPDKWADEPAEVLNFYAAARTNNQKGVTIPSQIRYVKYFAELCRARRTAAPTPETLLIERIRMTPWHPTLNDHSARTAKLVAHNKAAAKVGGVYAQQASNVEPDPKKKEKEKDNADGTSIVDASQISFNVFMFRTLVHSHKGSGLTDSGSLGVSRSSEDFDSERPRKKGSWLRRSISNKDKAEKKPKKDKKDKKKEVEVGLDDLDLDEKHDVDYTGSKLRMSNGPVAAAASDDILESPGTFSDSYFRIADNFPHLEIKPTASVPVCGDVKIDIYVGDGSKPKEQRVCAFWINTAMVKRRALAREARRRHVRGENPEPEKSPYDDEDHANHKWWDFSPAGGLHGECALAPDGKGYVVALQRHELDKALKDRKHFGDSKTGKSQGFRLIVELSDAELGITPPTLVEPAVDAPLQDTDSDDSDDCT